jgi:hypothetical protein
MVGGKISGPNGPSGPDKRHDPFQSFSSVQDQFEAAVKASFDDPDVFLETVIDDVLAMPPEERFEESINVIEEHYEDEFGQADTLAALLPFGQQWIESYLTELFSQVMTEVAKTAFHTREGGDWLVVLPVLQACNGAFEGVTEDSIEHSEKSKLFSALAALFFRLYREVKHEKDDGTGDFELVAMDLIRALEVIVPITESGVQVRSSDEVTSSAAYDIALQEGAMLCYVYAEISVGRGAELAGLSQVEFKQLLESYEITPRYGPQSISDLHSGVDLEDG